MNKHVGTDGTVGKALDLLDIVVGFGRPVRFSELVDESPYPKATVHRFLQTLTNQGMLYYAEDRHTYAPGLRLARLAHHAWQTATLAPLARPFIEALSHEISETVHLAQMEAGAVVFIDKVRPAEGFQTLAQPGRLAPAHCTGVGKAMIAYLDPKHREEVIDAQTFERFTPATLSKETDLRAELDLIAKSGIAYDRQEHEQGITSIAAPIFGAGDKVIGALSIVTSTMRAASEDLDRFSPALLRTAKQIGREASVHPYPVAH